MANARTRIGRVWVYEIDAGSLPRGPGEQCFRLVIENGMAILGRWVARTIQKRPDMGDYSVLYERQS